MIRSLHGRLWGGTPRIGLLSVLAMSVVLGACGPPSNPSASTRTETKPTSAPAAKSDAPAASPAAKPAGSPAAQVGGAPQVAITGPFEGEAQSLTGAGATFPAALYSRWFTEYERLTRVKVNYQSIGSGGGIKAITDKTVDFGATDGPMSNDQLAAAGAPILHVPMALGAVVATYNLPSVREPLKLSPENLAGIFLGEITRWNDPKLVADNAGLSSVDKNIVVVHRSDGSGTTFIFTDYLSSISPTWKSRVGNGTSVNWPTGLGAQGNEGVAGEVKQVENAIGYVELIYAMQNRLGVATIKNQAGNWVEPSLQGVTAAAAASADRIPADLRASIVNAPGPQAYPISGFTWLLAYQEMADKAKATALTRLMWWSIHDGQKFNGDLGYAPLPNEIVTRAENMISSMTSGGQKAFPGQ